METEKHQNVNNIQLPCTCTNIYINIILGMNIIFLAFICDPPVKKKKKNSHMGQFFPTNPIRYIINNMFICVYTEYEYLYWLNHGQHIAESFFHGLL